MPNAIMVIAPYRLEGTWVFDDPAVDLVREPFVAGVPEMIDRIVGNADRFRLTFSAGPFPGFEHELVRVREEVGGHWYRMDDFPEPGESMEGWLCPALFKYFDQAPERLYVRADPCDAGTAST